MNADLVAWLDFMERDKGIGREVLLEVIESSLLSAAKKSLGPARQLEVAVDSKSGEIKAYSTLVVVEKVANLHDEISLEEARRIDSAARLGEEVRKEVTPRNFGRIAAQVAKNMVVQKVREAEKEVVLSDFKERVGDIVTGVVRRKEGGNVVLELGRAEGFLPPREQSPFEDYRLGARLRALVLEAMEHGKGPQIMLSRTHPNFVRRLFEMEVPEIEEGVVEIKAIVREAGYRTKIAVWSSSDKVDSVGACVGLRGSRVKNVVRELGGEKIDIVPWSLDPQQFIINSLGPAKLKQVIINEATRTAEVVVDEDQLALAIGKKGQNVRLSSRLTDWKLEILREGDVMRGLRSAVHDLSLLPGVDEEIARKLVEAGYTDLEGIAIAEASDLAEITGLEEAALREIIAAAGKKKEE